MFADELNGWRRRAEEAPLVFALVVSLILHLLAYGGWQLLEKVAWNPARRLATAPPSQTTSRIVLDIQPLKEAAKREVPKPPMPPPMTFVDVDPATASQEPPKDAKYYSAISSKAANPTPAKSPDRPKIDGKQDKIVRTFDAAQTIPKPTTVKEEPRPPEPEPKQLAKVEPVKPQPKVEPKPALQPGRSTAATAAPKPMPEAKGTAEALRPEAVAPPRERPRTIAAAKAQQGMIAGERMKQDGGVERYSIEPSLDVKGSPFGDYDRQIVAAIQKRWYDQLDQLGVARGRQGSVVLEFKLHYDGSITAMNQVESSVGELLSIICQRAVLDPAPFPRWPMELRRLNQKDYREVRFTFYYN